MPAFFAKAHKLKSRPASLPPDDFCPMAPTLHRQSCTSTFPAKYRTQPGKILSAAAQFLLSAAGPLHILTVPLAALTVQTHYPRLCLTRKACVNPAFEGNSCVFGLQWGDEGKGKIVDFLGESADVVVRYCGGANAGHT